MDEKQIKKRVLEIVGEQKSLVLADPLLRALAPCNPTFLPTWL